MASPFVVLRTSMLFILVLVVIVWVYVNHVTSLTADAAAQAAITAAATAIPSDWACNPAHTSLAEAQLEAYRAVSTRLADGGVKARNIVVGASGCNVFARVTVGTTSARWSGLERTAVACADPAVGGPLAVVGEC